MEIGHAKTVTDKEEEGTEVVVKDVTGEVEEGVTITVVGTHSATYRKAADRASKKNFRHGFDIDSARGQLLETTARCIKSWKGFTSNGQDYPYTTENAIALLTAAPWVREQVEAAMNNHALFFPPPSAD